jgi:hypothetical protein
LLRVNRTDRAVFSRLRERRGVQWLVRLTSAINYSSFLSGMAKCLRDAGGVRWW